MKYDRELMKNMSENFKRFKHIMDSYVIIRGITTEEYDEAMKLVEKLIKKLKKGKGADVFNDERYREFVASGALDGDDSLRRETTSERSSKFGAARLNEGLDDLDDETW